MRDTESWMAPRPQAMAVPMIGLLVMLLVIAMGITPAIHGPTLPAAAAGTPVPRRQVAVGVDRDGHVWIIGVAEPGPVPDARLVERLRHTYAVQGDESAVLHLVADQRAPYARVQAVTRAAAEPGIRDIELIVECPRGRESLLRTCHR